MAFLSHSPKSHGAFLVQIPWHAATLLLLLSHLACNSAPQNHSRGEAHRETGKLDKASLENLEEQTEAFANRLLDLSIRLRQQNLQAMADFFADPVVATSFPHLAEADRDVSTWVGYHDWASSPDEARLTRETYLEQWSAFFGHFSSIEDCRLKVKSSKIEDGVIHARAYFFLVGRDQQSRREWAKGYFQVQGQLNDQGEWALTHLHQESFESQWATTDLFSEVSAPAGLAFELPSYGSRGNDSAFWHGSATADVDQDGLLDLFVTGPSVNHLYRNLGNGRFQDIAAESWTQILPPATGPLFFDMDADGDQDLFLAAPGNQLLLENRLIPDGKLEFRDISPQSGIGLAKGFGFSAIAGDVNNDGRLDIYVASYNQYGIVMPNSWSNADNGTPNLLFINLGEGKFKEAAEQWGVADRRWSYAAQFVDIDQDGDQDLYVANDYGHNGFFINQGTHFKDMATELGVVDPGNGMGVCFGDYDNDGDLDLHVTNMSSTAGNRILQRLFEEVPEKDLLVKLASGNSLYENQGDGTFKDVTQDVGGFSAGWAWGGGFVDFDNNGWEDVYTPNGFISGKSMKDT